MSTYEAAQAVGLRDSRRPVPLIWTGRLQAPAKRDTYGRYIWSDEDVERLRQALRTDRRRREHRTARQANT
jgi:hypothetical protein